MDSVTREFNCGSGNDNSNSVLLIGAGGLGCAAALALVAAVGMNRLRLGLVDPDRVALSNLQRQILYRSDDCGALKVTCARSRLFTHHHRDRDRDRDLCVELYPERLHSVEAIVERSDGYAVVLDGSDNFETRFAANDAALLTGIPLVHGAVLGFRGQIMSLLAKESACLRCLFNGPPPPSRAGTTCREAGVLGSLVGETGWLMALEAIKWITGTGKPLLNRFLTLEVMTNMRRVVPFSRNPNCPVCFQ